MPYDVITKDGITIRNIPDDVPRDSQSLKDRVAKIRAERGLSFASEEKPATQTHDETSGHKAEVAAGSVLESLPSAVGTALGGLGGGAAGSLAGPVGTVGGSIVGGVAGGKAVEDVANVVTRLGTRYLGSKEYPTYREYVRSKFAQPTTEGERLIKAGVGAATEIVPSILTGAAASKIPAAAANIKAAGKFLSASPLTQVLAGEAGALTTEATDSPMAGLAAGLTTPVAMSLLRRGVTPFPKELKGGAQSVVNIAKEEGVPLTTYQQTGRTGAKVTAPSIDFIEKQQLAFNKAAIKKTGHPGADYYTDEVREAIDKSWGPKFDALADETSKLVSKGRKGIALDTKFQNEMNSIYRNFYGPDPLSGQKKPFVDKAIEGVYKRLAKKNPSINGQEYKELRTALGSKAKSSSNSEERFALGKLISTLDEQMSRAAKRAGRPELADAWKKARNEYKNYLILENAFIGARDESKAIGNIDPSRFSGAVNAAEKRGYVGTKDDVYKLGKVSNYISGEGGEDLEKKLVSLARRWIPVSGLTGLGAGIGTLVGHPVLGGFAGAGAAKMASTQTGQNILANQLLAAPIEYMPTMASGARGAAISRKLQEEGQVEPEPERKAIGGLASLKKRYA